MPIRAASRRATYDVEVSAGSPSCCGSNSRNLGRSSSSAGRDQAVAADLAHDRGDVVAAAGRARRGDQQLHRLGDGVGLRQQERERRIADQAVQAVAAQEHAIAAAQLDDRQRRLDVVADAERLQDRAARARGLVLVVAGGEQRRLQRLIARDLDERARAQHVGARVTDGGDRPAGRRPRRPPTAWCPCRAGPARGAPSRGRRGSRPARRGGAGARTPRDRAWPACAFISRHITCAASSDAISPPSTPPMPSHTTSSGPRGPRAARSRARRARRAAPPSRSPTRKWSSLCSRTWPTSLAPATTTSRARVGRVVTSPAELDPQQLVAHADVVAVLERRRAGDAARTCRSSCRGR